jgi:CBS domain-containing protein
MEDIPRDSRLEFQMAIAGPGISGLLGLVAMALYGQLSLLLGVDHPMPILLWTLGSMNLILMTFNLLPAFPMDGGRVLRAWFAARMPYVTATRRAAGVGKLFAIIMIFLGLLSRDIPLIIIGGFIYIGASEEEQGTVISVSLEGVNVRRIMSSNLRTVPPDMTLRDLMNLMFYEKHRGFPVVENEALAGIITITDLLKVPDGLRDTTSVGDVMTRKIYVIGPEEEASSAMRKMNEHKIRRLPVLEDGRLVGIISREDLVRAIELCSERAS